MTPALRRIALTLTLIGCVHGPLVAQQAKDRIRPAPSAKRMSTSLQGGVVVPTANATTSLGDEVIYNNTCSTGYFHTMTPGERITDEGRIPSPSGPDNLNAKPGCAASYRVRGFEIGYCTDQPTIDARIAFYGSYTFCTSPSVLTPAAVFDLASLPGSSTASVACWLITIDLDAAPGATFVLPADGDGAWNPPSVANLFGWSISFPSVTQGQTGPINAGYWAVCSGFDGTRWDPVVNYSEEGTGMTTLYEYYLDGGTVATEGCYAYDSPMGSFHLKLYANACPVPPGLAFCAGDGSGTACPCGNTSPPGQQAGCTNSFGTAGRLRASGSARISEDTIVLSATDMPPTSVCLFFQGTQRQSGGAGSVLGDGLRCAGGVMTRIANKTVTAGSAQYPEPGDATLSQRGGVLLPGTRTYQSWYRNSAAFCTAATFNLTNGWEIAWGS